MKQSILILAILCTMAITAGFAQRPSNAADPGVVINGVRWATRNVATPGAFADKPEDAGMFYQWNRKKAWNATDSIIAGWDNTTPAGDTWEKANDPSPSGWRVPTREEIQSLFDSDSVANWGVTMGVIRGWKFVDKTTGNSIFLPAAGNRSNGSGNLYSTGKSGYYYSSTLTHGDVPFIYGFCFNGEYANMLLNAQGGAGYSVRCVAE